MPGTKPSKLFYPENNTLHLSRASFMAIYPGLYIPLLSSCHDNLVNRIQGTTEGFSGIVFFREKNGSFNASFTKISWKGTAAFLQVVRYIHGMFSKVKGLRLLPVTGAQAT